MDKILKLVYFLMDVISIPFVLISSSVIFIVRKLGEKKLTIANKLFVRKGLLPLRDYYFIPPDYADYLRKFLNQPNALGDIDLNLEDQLYLLKQLNFEMELRETFGNNINTKTYYQNENGISGDAGFAYMIIRKYKPKKLIIYGNQNFVFASLSALKKNQVEIDGYKPTIIYIDPYNKLEYEDKSIELLQYSLYLSEVGENIFSDLNENDIILTSFLNTNISNNELYFFVCGILPKLHSGVIMQINNIYGFGVESPKQYRNLYSNNSNLLKAFLLLNNGYKIIASLEYLRKKHKEILIEKIPNIERDKFLSSSVWIKKV